MQIALPGKLAQVAGVFWFVPRNVQRYCRSRTNQFVNGSTVFQLFINVARFARARETSKASPASADSPRGNSNAKCACLGDQVFNIDLPALQFPGEVIVVLLNPRLRFLVLL